ncbi:MAG: hypothetical protein LBN05_05125 [Oscillospiraceae bacterium]|jgi:hypothetical protein|nr:hypothetical protein [Oscillospiraceae bacterium]
MKNKKAIAVVASLLVIVIATIVGVKLYNQAPERAIIGTWVEKANYEDYDDEWSGDAFIFHKDGTFDVGDADISGKIVIDGSGRYLISNDGTRLQMDFDDDKEVGEFSVKGGVLILGADIFIKRQ